MEVLGDNDGRADSGSNGGGAVNGDARGEASDNDDELPETASSFLFRGEGVSLAAWLGEATTMLESSLLRPARLALSCVSIALSCKMFSCKSGVRTFVFLPEKALKKSLLMHYKGPFNALKVSSGVRNVSIAKTTQEDHGMYK